MHVRVCMSMSMRMRMRMHMHIHMHTCMHITLTKWIYEKENTNRLPREQSSQPGIPNELFAVRDNRRTY